MAGRFEDVLARVREKVWVVVERYLADPVYPQEFVIEEKYREWQELNWEIAGEYPRRKGKYGRAALILLACGAMGGEEEKALTTAAAMQLSEDWLLVHDDFEDSSEMRRGGKALHKIYGDRLAVNAGDLLHVSMWKALLDNRGIVGEEKAFRIMDEFYKCLMRTAFGQMVELKWTQESRDVSWEDWLFVVDGKTSYYTVTLPLRLGVILAGGSEVQLGEITKFGKILGRCFQLVDDILDVSGDFRGLKGRVGNDIYEGKRTAILGHLIEVVSGRERKRVIEIMGKRADEKSVDEVEWVLALMREKGSIEYAREKAKEMADEARRCFVNELGFLAREPYRGELLAGIDFLLNRDH